MTPFIELLDVSLPESLSIFKRQITTLLMKKLNDENIIQELAEKGAITLTMQERVTYRKVIEDLVSSGILTEKGNKITQDFTRLANLGENTLKFAFTTLPYLSDKFLSLNLSITISSLSDWKKIVEMNS